MTPNDFPGFVFQAVEDAYAFWLPPAPRSPVPVPVSTAQPVGAPHAVAAGTFLPSTFTNALGSRDYKLYVPSGVHDAPMPLVVMLHGCRQDPDDFAAGTRMNQLAQRHGFLVAYPAQKARSNGANCWNWFETQEQTRAGQEPSLIAGIVGAIGAQHRVDPARVFVAGLSAGASMAVILGQTHPELFAAVAAHSGVPLGSAHDVASAFAAMQGQMPPPKARSASRRAARPVRTLVLHGDADRTVEWANGRAITQDAIAAFKRAKAPVLLSRRTGAAGRPSPQGTRNFVDAGGRVMVRECTVHGGSHAWFGGSTEGSFTEHAGLDASAEIVRFFLGAALEDS